MVIILQVLQNVLLYMDIMEEKNTKSEELWRIYMPTKTKYRFLSNWSSSLIQGIRQLPITGDSLIITKSQKDVMSLCGININAISSYIRNYCNKSK